MSNDLTKQYDLSAQRQDVQTSSNGIKYCLFSSEEEGGITIDSSIGKTVSPEVTKNANLLVVNPNPTDLVKAVWVKGNKGESGIHLTIEVLGSSEEDLSAFYKKKQSLLSSFILADLSKPDLSGFGFAPRSFQERETLVSEVLQMAIPCLDVSTVVDKNLMYESQLVESIGRIGTRYIEDRRGQPTEVPDQVMTSLTHIEENNLFSDGDKVNDAMVDIIRNVLVQQLQLNHRNKTNLDNTKARELKT